MLAAAKYVDATNQDWLKIARKLGMTAPKPTDLGHGSRKVKTGSEKANSFMSNYIEEIWSEVVKLDPYKLMDVQNKRLAKAKSTLKKHNL